MPPNPSKPASAVRSAATLAEYKTTTKYLKRWGYRNGTFADFLAQQPKLTPATQVKHLRQAKIILPAEKHHNLGDPPKLIETPPPIFSDDDFQKLYQAFENAAYPTFILPEYRARYWQVLFHFASITALRRQAILGIELSAINFNEKYITINPSIDKKHQVRYKPITPELAADILDLIQHYDKTKIHPAQHNRLFPWKHGNKTWYANWHLAEQTLGKRFHLHDLKRFSGELALRAGATPMELQQHMDHASLNTTLKHYTRPQTKELVVKIKVPIPDRENKITPLFGEGLLKEILGEIITKKLADLGIDTLVSLDKFGIPTNISPQEITESDQRIPKEKKPANPQRSGDQRYFPTMMPRKEGTMIKTLAKIKGYAAKAAFSILIGNNGTITQKELIQAGFTASRAKEAMLQLQINDIVIKITAGVYRVKEEARPQSPEAHRRAVENTEAHGRAPEADRQSPEARPQATEPILESASSRKYTLSPKARPQSPEARPRSPEAHRRADSAEPVNVVNNMLLPRQEILS